MPLISLIVPCYEQAKYLRECIDSIVAQTFTDWDCIIIDDGSSDRTTSVAKACIAEYPDRDIRLIQQENTGVATARNRAISQCKGQYFVPVDADDSLAPHALDAYANCIAENLDIAWILCDYYIVTPTQQVYQSCTASDQMPIEEFERRLLVNNCSVVSACIQKKAWKAVGGYPASMLWGMEDWAFFVALQAKGYAHAVVREAVLNYRYDPNTINRDSHAVRHLFILMSQIHYMFPERISATTHALATRLLCLNEELARDIQVQLAKVPDNPSLQRFSALLHGTEAQDLRQKHQDLLAAPSSYTEYYWLIQLPDFQSLSDSSLSKTFSDWSTEQKSKVQVVFIGNRSQEAAILSKDYGIASQSFTTLSSALSHIQDQGKPKSALIYSESLYPLNKGFLHSIQSPASPLTVQWVPDIPSQDPLSSLWSLYIRESLSHLPDQHIETLIYFSGLVVFSTSYIALLNLHTHGLLPLILKNVVQYRDHGLESTISPRASDLIQLALDQGARSIGHADCLAYRQRVEPLIEPRALAESIHTTLVHLLKNDAELQDTLKSQIQLFRSLHQLGMIWKRGKVSDKNIEDALRNWGEIYEKIAVNWDC